MKPGIIIGVVVIVLLFVIFFNREPIFKVEKYGLTSPAYGKVYKVERNEYHTIISIVLDIFDIHAQYYPTDGVVSSHTYDRTGQFNLIFDLNKSAKNEKLITKMYDIYSDEITIMQIAGMTTRRIIHIDKKNTQVSKGDKLGRILLGSRVDIILPTKYIPQVKIDDYVNGPRTIIAIRE